MAKFKLAFGIHNHQPVGNFDAVFEEAHVNAYAPILKLLKDFSSVRISLHQSGILWAWQQNKHPEYFELVRELIQKKQIDLMTGGFYEPIICAIPAEDAKDQILLLNKYLKENFGENPKGLWLAERVWEPHLPKILSESGVDFVAVDDTHLISAGFQPEHLSGPFITEDSGQAVTLLPIQKKLRYLIPYGSVDEVITELKRQANENPEGVAAYADDGEKFGVWPGSNKLCYEDGWLRKFFKALESNSDWLEVVSLSEVAKLKPVGRAYLPSASYAEMSHWSLPAKSYVDYEDFESWLKTNDKYEQYGQFVTGGHWRNFLSKYEEANAMHKKMLQLSIRLRKLENGSNLDSDTIDGIKENLFAGQCNCPYWHGVFGGLYLPHIRQAIYSSLIEAEREIIKAEEIRNVKITEYDHDLDGHTEIAVSTNFYSALFRPAQGGSLQELSLLNHGFNLTDTLTRRAEGYHRKLKQVTAVHSTNSSASIHDRVIAKEDDLHKVIALDWYQKRCFIDHVFDSQTSFEDFKSGNFKEDGDLILEPYSSIVNGNTIELSRQGTIRQTGGVTKIKVSKKFEFQEGSEKIKIVYSLSTCDEKEIELLFGIENNFSFQAGHADDRYILIDGIKQQNCYLDSDGQYDSVQNFSMVDEYLGLALDLKSKSECQLWHTPIFTVSMSDGGFEKVYQGTTFVNLFRLTLSTIPVNLEFELQAGDIKT